MSWFLIIIINLFFRLTCGWVHCCWNVVKIYIGWKVYFLFRVWMRGLSFRWVWCHWSWSRWYLKILGSGCLKSDLIFVLYQVTFSKLNQMTALFFLLYYTISSVSLDEPVALRWHTRNRTELFSKDIIIKWNWFHWLGVGGSCFYFFLYAQSFVRIEAMMSSFTSNKCWF